MKFIKIGDSIFETTSIVIFRQHNIRPEIHISNLSGNTTITYDTEAERDAEFDRIENILIPREITTEERYQKSKEFEEMWKELSIKKSV